MKYYAADVGPAIGAVARLMLLLGRAFGQYGWEGALPVLLVVVGLALAVWYVVRNRMRNGEDAPTQQVDPVTSTIPRGKLQQAPLEPPPPKSPNENGKSSPEPTEPREWGLGRLL